MEVSSHEQTDGQMFSVVLDVIKSQDLRLDVLIDRVAGLFADCWENSVECRAVEKHKI